MLLGTIKPYCLQSNKIAIEVGFYLCLSINIYVFLSISTSFSRFSVLCLCCCFYFHLYPGLCPQLQLFGGSHGGRNRYVKPEVVTGM